MSNAKKGVPAAQRLLSSGLPFEMHVYEALAAIDKTVNVNWIEPDYPFVSLDRDLVPVHRSVDFVASVMCNHWLQLYFLVECKYAVPDDDPVWVFAPEHWPQPDLIFGGYRPRLWCIGEPTDPGMSEVEPDVDAAEQGGVSGPPRRRLPPHSDRYCVKGTSLLTSQAADFESGKREPRDDKLQTGLHQLRDALHHLAIERFRLFTKAFDRPHCICFVPVLCTNAPLKTLRADRYAELLDATKGIQLSDATLDLDWILCRVPKSPLQVADKWRRFWDAHGAEDLMAFAQGVPAYKRIADAIGDLSEDTATNARDADETDAEAKRHAAAERAVRYHLENFFSVSPSHVAVVQASRLPTFLADQLTWAGTLVSPVPDITGATSGLVTWNAAHADSEKRDIDRK